MPTIHVPGDGHTEPAPDADGTRWDAYTDPAKIRTLNQALFILRHNVRGMKPCNDCFSALPGGRTFDAVLDDPTVFISFDPRGLWSGTTDGNDITIGKGEFAIGRWSVAATLVHELAHVNGAPGGNSAAAENTLPCCGMSGLFRAGAVGLRDQDPNTRTV